MQKILQTEGEERQRLVFRPNGVRGKESMREIRLPDLRPEIRFSHPFNAITAQHQYQNKKFKKKPFDPIYFPQLAPSRRIFFFGLIISLNNLPPYSPELSRTNLPWTQL
ncbi:hypothetical protein CEXT_443381 [Caerostris extrusa]|uniref:Uncharacterized protein n=1 Tax=Caerostris extrusa TaxID=172846 RepID=A0AAV4W558_CAEEX|nr:hypothetical protein CEXT_443381 [Caerostris extrusa]